MSEDNLPSIDIPTYFYDTNDKVPMRHCINCDKELIESGSDYIIEKAFRHYQSFNITNTIFEYAMCMECVYEMNQRLSSESAARIAQYFEQHISMQERHEQMMNDHGAHFEGWLEKCLISGQSIEDLEEFQVCCQCRGDQMIFTVLPYMISHHASDEMMNLLSAKSLDDYNRFVDDNFGLPPEWKEALKTRPGVLI